MKIITKKISYLKPYKLNAKKHPQSQIDGISESIRRFGFTQPVVVDKRGTIIIGHGRVEAAKVAGLKKIPCVVRGDLTADEVRALRLIDNRIAETGFDTEMLKLDLAGFKMDFEPFFVDFSAFQNVPEFKPSDDGDKKLDHTFGVKCPKCGFKIER